MTKTFLRSIVLFLMFSVKVFSQANLLNGLQACYPLDCAVSGIISNAASTGSALNGTVMGNVTCTTGHFNAQNTAMHFGGTTSDFILLPSSPLIKPTTSLTVSGWFYFDSYIHSDMIFTRNTCVNSNFNMNNLIWDNGQIMLAKRPGASNSCGSGAILTTSLSTLLPLNTWHHIVYYVDDSVLEVTINNGTPFTLLHSVAFDYGSQKEVVLGGTNELAANNPFLGSMDDLRFYDRKLTAGEISYLYNTASACSESAVLNPSFALAPDVCLGYVTTFTNLSTQQGTSFNWSMPGGNPSTSSSYNASAVFNTPGIYTISLMATNSAGSSVTVSKTVQVTPCVSIEDASLTESFQIYPNPASTEFWVTIPGDPTIRLLDVSGKETLIAVVREGEYKYKIGAADLPQGLYFVLVETGLGITRAKKMVVSR